MSTIQERIAEIKGRCEAATPGPWLRDTTLASGPFVMTNRGRTLLEHHERDGMAWHDCDFTAKARSDLPALAQALGVAVAALEEIDFMSPARELGLTPYRRRTKQALQEIERLLGGTKNE